MKKYILLLIGFVCTTTIIAQLQPDVVYFNTIKSIKLFQQNNQESLPIINLNSADLLELHFDDLDGGYTKNYYYTYQLCSINLLFYLQMGAIVGTESTIGSEQVFYLRSEF
jgi:hypothetical protein